MHIYLMTDMEGVCGITNAADWCSPQGPYYEKGKALLTAEANAAIAGFLEAGALQVTVADGHGHGGLDPVKLHPQARFMRGWPKTWPFLLDAEHYDAVAWVGQHAKAGATHAHLAHTQSFACRDESVNRQSLGEFGQFALCAGELGVPVLFGAGDHAFTKEVEALTPGVETVAVKWGTQPDPGHHLPAAAYAVHNVHAIHLSPEEACKRIRDGARHAVERAQEEDFGLVRLDPPYERVTVLRSNDTEPPRVARNTHPDSIIALFNQPFNFTPLAEADPLTFT